MDIEPHNPPRLYWKVVDDRVYVSDEMKWGYKEDISIIAAFRTEAHARIFLQTVSSQQPWLKIREP